MRVWAVLFLLVLLAGSRLVWGFSTHDVGANAEEREAVLGDASGGGYVASGCWLQAPSSGLTLTLPACEGYAMETTGTRLLKYFRQPATTWTLPSGDGTWWLLGQWRTTAQAGFQPLPGTHFLWTSATTRPAAVSGTLLLAKVKAVAGVVTVRNLWATNPHTPGTIYGTDPAIGMVCDGRTDDTLALQRALDLSNQRSGTTVELPDGTCAVKNVVMRHQSDDPGGIDLYDGRNGCATLAGQGPQKTVLTGTTDMAASDFILRTACLPLGAGQGFPPFRFGTGATIRDLGFYGDSGRTRDYHGLVADGSYVRLQNLHFAYISGHALWVGKDIKQESGWYENIQVRSSGRYTVDNGRGPGLSGGGSSNEAAVLFDSPADGSRNNNISVYGLQVVYNWYSSLHIKCNPKFNSELFFYGSMIHNHEAVDASNQGRLDDQAGMVNIDGPCLTVAFIGANVVSPGSDAPDTNDASAPAVPAFYIHDSAGVGGADMVVLDNVYLNFSQVGQAIKIDKARTVFLHNVRGGSDTDPAPVDFARGQLVIAPGAFTGGFLSVCQTYFHPPYMSMPYADAGTIRECGRSALSWTMPNDTTLALAESSGAWNILAANTATIRPHTLPCTPQPQQIQVQLTTTPGNCKAFYLTDIDATNFTINCDTAPGGSTISGVWGARVPGCGAAAYELPETPLFGSSRQYFIHGIWFIPDNPAPTSTATDYKTLTLSKRRLLSLVPFAHVSNQTPWNAWTPVAFTIDVLDELLWSPNDQIVLHTEATGGGSALGGGLIVLQVGTEVFANK